MNFLQKYWKIIEVPVILMGAWTLINVALPITAFLSNPLLIGLVSWGITIIIFGLVGYNSVKEKLELSFCAKSGAVAGAITALFGSIMSIFTYYVFPQRFSEAIAQAVSQGASMEMIQTMTKFGLYANLLIAPILSAIFGAAIAAISFAIFNKILNKQNHTSKHKN